ISIKVYVILIASTYYVQSFLSAVDIRYLNLFFRFPRCFLICEEIMLQPVDQRCRTVFNIIPASVNAISLHNGNYLIIRLIIVDHTQSSNSDGFEEYITLVYGLFCQHANVEGVTISDNIIPPCFFSAVSGYLFSAESLRDKAIGCGTY